MQIHMVSLYGLFLNTFVFNDIFEWKIYIYLVFFKEVLR